MPSPPSDTIHFKRAFREAELAPVTGAIREGRVLSVMGPRQPEAGKTTLLHAVMAQFPNHVFMSGERSLGFLRLGTLCEVSLTAPRPGPQRRRLDHL